jgi:hypothetical protein
MTTDGVLDTSSPADAAAEEEELLLLALVDQFQADYAAGRHPDIAAYCAANPELRNAFLSLALAMDPPEQEEALPSAEESTRRDRTLSPGVLRALASIGDFAGDADDLVTGRRSQRQARVAEEPGNYDLQSRTTRTSKGDS